ncbi:MAG: ABC1 kinase family protein [bacterium]
MELPHIRQTIKNIKRLRQILNVLIKHGFGHIIEQLNLQYVLSTSKRIFALKKPSIQEKERIGAPVRLRLVFEELGPTFIKFAQLLSLRRDLVPEEYAEELKKLQDKLSPIPFEEIKKVIEEELHGTLDDFFLNIEKHASGAASIAQVHRGILKTGEDIIVKIQRPGIENIIFTDLNILFHLSHLIEKYLPETRPFNPTGIVEEFSKSIRKELDFTLEANYTQRFYKNFKDDDTVLIPKVFWEFCTKKVLVLKRLAGIPVNKVEEFDKLGWDKYQIALNGCNAFLKQILEFGLFHGDPHPGNLFVMDAKGTIGLVDFGIVGRLDEDLIANCTNVLFAFLNKNYDQLIHEYTKLGFLGAGVDMENFRRDFIDFIETYYDCSLKQINIGQLLNNTIQISLKHGIIVPTDLMLLGKTLLFIEEVGRQLDPTISLIEISRPYAKHLLKERMKPRTILNILKKNTYYISEVAKSLPKQLLFLLNRLSRGEQSFQFEHKGLENLIKEIKQSSNRLSLSLVIASLIIGSSIIMSIHKGPSINGYSILGITGFSFAGIMGIWLLIQRF